jgi:hypothetical protein
MKRSAVAAAVVLSVFAAGWSADARGPYAARGFQKGRMGGRQSIAGC